MPDALFYLKVSRPRFWIYVFGPYLVGLAAAVSSRSEFVTLETVVFGLYFLLPANLLIYGINDIFDYETDRLNPKKESYETLVRRDLHFPLLIGIAVLNIPFLAAALYFAPQALPSFAGFVFLSLFYSAPPIRAKAIPVVDSIFNVLYVFPGAFAFQMITGSFPPLTLFAAAWLWSMAMHAFSAVPDIDSDRSAGLSTVATFLGRSGTIVFCLAAYALSAAAAFPHLGVVGVFAGSVYVGIMIYALMNSEGQQLFRIYRIFPLLNSLIGFAVFWYAAIPKVL